MQRLEPIRRYAIAGDVGRAQHRLRFAVSQHRCPPPPGHGSSESPWPTDISAPLDELAVRQEIDRRAGLVRRLAEVLANMQRTVDGIKALAEETEA